MIKTLKAYCAPDYDPYYNLAVEQYLLESVEPGQCIVYLWQNQNTVVIGRNQNSWKECRTALLQEEGGHLARRLSGGGAVFHDLGNLNFTFLVSAADYSLDLQLGVILKAMELLGLEAERSGRNDVLCDGRKFSGNAFYKHEGRSYHHGTLLVDADMGKLGRYLTPSKAKLQSKGVDSVRSRVMNLREKLPDLTIDRLKEVLLVAFSQVYGYPVEMMGEASLNVSRVEELRAHYGSWDWLFGRKIPMTFQVEAHFSWGSFSMELQADEGRVSDCRVYSDSMDWDAFPALEQSLIGCTFTLEELSNRVRIAVPELAEDICGLLKENL